MTMPSLLVAVMASVLVASACSADSRVRAERANASAGASTGASAPPNSDVPPVGSPGSDAPPDETHPEHPDSDNSAEIDVSTTEPAPDTGDGVGDELFLDLGNPGIDVENYRVALVYDVEDDTIAGSVTLTIVPTQDRSEFTLDSVGNEIIGVSVDGKAAAFTAEDVELRVTPRSPLLAGRRIEVDVEYRAAPDSGTSLAGLPNGWFHTDSGSYVLNEPDGARTWLPSNDHPLDKATWTFEITVPEGLVAVANGALLSQTTTSGGVTWVWRENRPMATYLIQLLTGEYEIVEGEGPNGLPLLSAVLSRDRDLVQPYLDTIDEQIDFFDDFFGPYPLDSYGLAITDSSADWPWRRRVDRCSVETTSTQASSATSRSCSCPMS